MSNPVGKTVVISAVNIRKGGTLTVLKECLGYLSSRKDLQVTALVHNRKLCDYPNIQYIEIPWSIKSWWKRLKCEYKTMRDISEQFPNTDLWLSLHDTTPNVKAKKQAVYCQTSFPFLKVLPQDFLMDKKIPLFALLTQFAYRKNVHRNNYLIVQQNWLREGLSRKLHVAKDRFIVAPPKFEAPAVLDSNREGSKPTVFFFPASPDCHKNFETICDAAEIVEKKLGTGVFKVIITIKGDENKYASWLKKHWGHVSSIDFCGYLPKDDLYDLYRKADCLLFPSRVETWGLPISEFIPTGKPMILADLPYAHETAAGAERVAFSPVRKVWSWAKQMELVIRGKINNFVRIMPTQYEAPYAPCWEDLFEILLNDESTPTR